MESLCDVAIHANGVLAHYLRVTGQVRYIRGKETMVEPVGTVGAPSLSWHLAPGIVEESCWSVFPRRGVVWEDICQLPRWDGRTAASVASQNAKNSWVGYGAISS